MRRGNRNRLVEVLKRTPHGDELAPTTYRLDLQCGHHQLRPAFNSTARFVRCADCGYATDEGRRARNRRKRGA